MILDLQRRIQEAGRIRIGQQVATKGGKSRPEKLATFRLTSADRTRIDQAAALFGGKPAQWQAPAGAQWEVVTEADSLDVIVPPSDMAFSQWYELWSAGGCQRRCDGNRETITDGPCLCDPAARECDIHTRLSVMLASLPGLGVWRIDTSGYYAAVEMSGAVQVIQAAAGRGALLPARLRLEQRVVKRPGPNGTPQTRRFAVPVLDVEITPAQLMAPAAPVAAIEDGRAGAAAAAPLTPVPALPAAAERSVAEQAQAPEPAPRRANSAPAIPRSGRRRNPTPEPEPAPEPEPTAGPVEPPEPMTDRTRGQMFALFGEVGITDENDQRAGMTRILGREVTSRGDLTEAEAQEVVFSLQAHRARMQGEGGDES